MVFSAAQGRRKDHKQDQRAGTWILDAMPHGSWGQDRRTGRQLSFLRSDLEASRPFNDVVNLIRGLVDMGLLDLARQEAVEVGHGPLGPEEPDLLCLLGRESLQCGCLDPLHLALPISPPSSTNRDVNPAAASARLSRGSIGALFHR